MARIGYARVSSTDQDLALQIERLKGGTRRIDREAVQSLRREGKDPTEIAKALGISRMHAYRLIKAM